MFKINIRIDVTGNGVTVRDALVEMGYTVYAPCGGNGTCGKCKMKLFGDLSAPDSAELKLLTAEELRQGYRLSCMAKINGSASAEYEFRDMNVLTEGVNLGGNTPVQSEGYAVAVDIGTTTVAVYLCSLSTGCVIDVRGIKNPQSAFGGDVISRITYLNEHDGGLDLLANMLIGSINDVIKEFGIKTSEIVYISVAGNTVMQHIVARINPRTIAIAPFTAPTLFGCEYDACALGFDVGNSAKLYFMPCFASYVGGDIASGIAACDIDLSDGYELFIDIGTNGEIAVGNRSRITLCAAAAGPAFEGASIECGMAGVEGAINKIYTGEDALTFDVIGNVEPKGICGSALIDVAAYLLDREIIDETGMMEENFYLDREHNIYVTPRDIREIQLAKAAIAAGIYTIVTHGGKKLSDITAVKIAGGFGAFINKKSACRLGLIPSELEDKIEIVGNTAGAGAVKYLLNADFRERIRHICDNSEYVELSGDTRFMNFYMEQMCFGDV